MRKELVCLLSLTLIGYQATMLGGKKKHNGPQTTTDQKTASTEGADCVVVSPPSPQPIEPAALAPQDSIAITAKQEAGPANLPQMLEKTAQVKAGVLNAEMAKWFWKGRRDLLQKLQKEYDPSRHIFGSSDTEETKLFIQETLKSMQYHQQYDDLASSLNFIEEQKVLDLDRSLRQSLRKTLKMALSSAQDARKKALTAVIRDQSKAVDEQIKKLSVTILAADEALAKQNAQDTSVIQVLRRGLHATATLHKPGEVESDDEGEPSSHYATPATLRTHLGIETTTLLSDDNRASLQKVLALKLFSAQQASEPQQPKS